MPRVGYKQTEQHRLKIRVANLGKTLSQRTKQKLSDSRIGKTKEELGHNVKVCKCCFCRAKRREYVGDNHPFFGKPRPEHSKKISGINNPNWNSGSSLLPYAFEFDENLKYKIRQRDNFTCQFCGIVENGESHISHHIDYNKMNCVKTNLILLCRSCNGKANHQREKWQFLFESLQEIRRARAVSKLKEKELIVFSKSGEKDDICPTKNSRQSTARKINKH